MGIIPLIILALFCAPCPSFYSTLAFVPWSYGYPTGPTRNHRLILEKTKIVCLVTSSVVLSGYLWSKFVQFSDWILTICRPFPDSVRLGPRTRPPLQYLCLLSI
ncbi:uncharacterized protein GGS25DRAFT_58687 [Hypoxylon fragiforme]|uniref:uncharacterized protein n=1 Tax=Hypoxylon fragiforme TaxID=63214 RepID=UPI0020C5DE4F|nr:uncharacterized protein GGS25DRAFT_58687 [Hypoxylon fragiforme]KAI2614621.1 hypothetical protein GGS25DRAFT_58687 [Hypoxylon fragiforme]